MNLTTERLKTADSISGYYQELLNARICRKHGFFNPGSSVAECQEVIQKLLKEGDFKNVSQALKFRRETKEKYNQ